VNPDESTAEASTSMAVLSSISAKSLSEAQFDNLLLNQGQPLDVASHEGRPLANPQVFRRLFAPVLDNVVGNLGALGQRADLRQAGRRRPAGFPFGQDWHRIT
jgi:hypothetical protein